MNGIRRNLFSKLIFYINFKGIFKKNTKAIRFRHLCFKSSTDTALRGWIELLQSRINKLIKTMQIPAMWHFFFHTHPIGFELTTIPFKAPLPFIGEGRARVATCKNKRHTSTRASQKKEYHVLDLSDYA